MFTKHNKIKETVVYVLKKGRVSCLVSENKQYAPVGVSKVMTHNYSVDNIEVVYNKWFVESFDLAEKMNLAGCEHHDKLVKGSGVVVSSATFGTHTFYDKDAMDIISACEYKHGIEPYVMQKQR